MNAFSYVRAESIVGATKLSATKQGSFLAGGIDLLGEMKEYIVSPELVIDLKTAVFQGGKTPVVVPAPPHILPDHSGIGFYKTMAELAEDAVVREKFPALAQAAGEVGSPQIRNVATLGGNLLQHSRCWYYRQPDIVCLKRGGTKCYAQEGENKYLALFSGCECISPLVSNTAVALAVLEAKVYLILGERVKDRIISMHDLYAKAWTDAQAHNSLPEHAVITDVLIPNKAKRSAYKQVSERGEFDWALVSCAAAGVVENGMIRDARVALGAVAPGPYMVEEAHDFLEGKALNEETVAHAAEIILREAKPLAHNGYKVPVARALIMRTLLALNE